MQIQFLYHSGFAFLGKHATVVIDYYDPKGKGPATETLFEREGPLYLLSSHSHHDHYSAAFFQKAQQLRPDAHIILASEIRRSSAQIPSGAVFLHRGESYDDGVLHVEAYDSTDIGVSFYLEFEGKKLFHAGDLNDWHWQEESTKEEIRQAHGSFLAALRALVKAHPALDAACFPVDPRMGKDFWLGAKIFLETIDCKCLFPMHFWEDFSAQEKFLSAMGERGGCIFPFDHYGQCVSLD